MAEKSRRVIGQILEIIKDCFQRTLVHLEASQSYSPIRSRVAYYPTMVLDKTRPVTFETGRRAQ